ncbi:hypothetical protein ACS0TY_009274 [Phlomoides rotata]
MRSITRRQAEILWVMEAIRRRTVGIIVFALAILWLREFQGRNIRQRQRRWCLLDRIPRQIRNMNELVELSDEVCKDMLRMDRLAFSRLCNLLQDLGGLTNSKYVNVQEKVAMFLSILAHHTKNRSIKFQFKRSGQTVSKHFHSVLKSVLKLHSLFLVQPEPVAEDSEDPRWQNFKAGPHVKTMRYKSWPYYGFWQEIFGKDRATGEHAAGAMDLVNELLKTEAAGAMDPVEKVGENTNSPYEIPEHIPETTSVCKPSELGSKKSKGTKRKSGESEICMLADKLGDFIQSSDSTFNNLAQRFGNEHEAKASRTSLIEIMNKVPGLKLHDKLKAADELVQNTNRLELFLSLPEEERYEYVWMLLDGHL